MITGRKPLPVELKILHGETRKERLPDSPQPEKAAPPMPRGMEQLARKFWQDHADKLERLGLLTEVDGPAFAMCATHWAIAFLAARAIREEGLYLIDGDGAKRKHPLLQVMRDNSAAFRAWAVEFGLTPSSRARISIPEPAEDDDLLD
jgi:P27 family predicted phage terminase small subunit